MRVAYGREEQAALADDTDGNAVLLHLPARQAALLWLHSLSQAAPSRQRDLSAGQQLRHQVPQAKCHSLAACCSFTCHAASHVKVLVQH